LKKKTNGKKAKTKNGKKRNGKLAVYITKILSFFCIS
jgi:hypothetical protein